MHCDRGGYRSGGMTSARPCALAPRVGHQPHPHDECAFQSLFAEPTRNGLTRPKAVRGTGIKMVNMGELFAHTRLKGIAMDRVPLDLKKEPQYLLQDRDLLFARQSLVLKGAGKCSIFFTDHELTTFESHVIRVRLDPSLADPLYYYYYWQSHQGQSGIRSIVEQGAGASGIRATDLATLPVAWRPVEEQRTIAHILGTLDDKIELNRRMNETLEGMSQALFKSWFEDFEPVRANAEPGDARLAHHAYELFPDSFDDSALGKAPRGWKVVALTELIDVNPQRPALRKGEIAPYVPMSSMPTSGHTPSQISDRPFGSGMRFTNGDTLVARITPCLENGKTAYVDFVKGGQVAWGSTEYIVLRPKPFLPSEFAYCLARSPGFREFAIQSMTGTSGRQRVQPTALGQFLLPQPPEQVGKEFGRLIRPLIGRARTAADESQRLAALRDALLPRLLSGELRVPDAERIAAAVI